MGREVRRVPATWQHPESGGSYRPLLDGYRERVARWKAEFAAWERGERPSYCEAGYDGEFWDWDGDPPHGDDYTPDWPAEERTHYQMYETTSEGTPISPVMESPEALARWLADNEASAFGDRTATYEQWLCVCLGDSAPSAVIQNGAIRSGVEAIADSKRVVS